MNRPPNSKVNLDRATVDEAIIWANDLISRIDGAR